MEKEKKYGAAECGDCNTCGKCDAMYDEVVPELKGFDDKEFDAFIKHLKDLNYIFEPREAYIKLAGYDDLKCVEIIG